jgi:hypothetical protein
MTQYDFAMVGAQVTPKTKLPCPDAKLLEHVYEQSKLVETLTDADTLKLLRRVNPGRIIELKQALQHPELLSGLPESKKRSIPPESKSRQPSRRLKVDCEIVVQQPELEAVLKLGVTPLGQVPTSKAIPTVGSHKKLVFVLPDNVYKGPFGPENAADCAALQLIFERQRLLTQFGDDIALTNELVQVGSVYFLRSRNIATTLPQQWQTEERTTKAGTFTVIKRNSLGFVKLVDWVRDEPVRIQRFCLPLLKHLIASTLLEPAVGDLVLSNLLVAGDALVAIDYEERRGSFPGDGKELWNWLFSHRPAASVIKQIEVCLPQHCQALLAFIDGLRNQPVNLERLEIIRQFIVKHL